MLKLIHPNWFKLELVLVLIRLPVSFQRCYYMSLEYYIGRTLTNTMLNIGIQNGKN